MTRSCFWWSWSALFLAGAVASCAGEPARSAAESGESMASKPASSTLPAVSAQDASAQDGATMPGGDAASDASASTLEEDPGPKPALCARTDRSDAVRDAFCASGAPRIRSLADLQTALRLVLPRAELGFGAGGALLLAHSTALSGDVVSELNPRAILATPKLFVAFSRGVQQVELAARDQLSAVDRVNLYLLSFEQACNNAPEGCRPGDLYTPRIESDWLKVSLEDDEDLKNTPADCRQCHQRGIDHSILLMRELDGPWTHFFAPDADEPEGFPEPTGSALLRDYLRAKGDEAYANLPTEVLRNTVGITLQNLVHRPQPLLFDGSDILNERWPWHPETMSYSATPERSAIWYEAYDAFKRGEQLPLPYFAPRVSDAKKQAKLTEAYQRYRNGELDAAELPDFADIFPDDPQVRAEIGLQTEPHASPAQTLIQACGPCHNDVLDQSISRARFNVALGRMSRAERDLAISRIELPHAAPGAMPPSGRRTIDPGARKALLDYLRSDERSAVDDAMLEHAAERGMAGMTARK